MQKTVIILIGAGVCCVVIGLTLFLKLCFSKKEEDEGSSNSKKLLDEEYPQNFRECFEDTGTIEGTLEQLADIYMNDQFMYNLILSSLTFIKEEDGDYETALEKINVDSSIEIMKMHDSAIKKAVGHENAQQAPQESEPASNSKASAPQEFEEDDDEEKEEPEKPVSRRMSFREKRAARAEETEETDDDDEEDIDGFKIG